MKKEDKHIKNFLIFKTFQEEDAPKKYSIIPVIIVAAILIGMLFVLVKYIK